MKEIQRTFTEHTASLFQFHPSRWLNNRWKDSQLQMSLSWFTAWFNYSDSERHPVCSIHVCVVIRDANYMHESAPTSEHESVID